MTPFRKYSAIFIFVLPVLIGNAGLTQELNGDGAASLLFSSNEARAIEAALALRPFESAQIPDGDASEQRQIPENRPSWQIERLHLSALIYTDPQTWTLWFGARRVLRNAVPPYLTDLRVTANHVDLSVIPKPGAAPIPVRLRPNQTFLIGQRRITEAGQGGN